MLIFNSKLDNSISGTIGNVNDAIASIDICQVLKTSLSDITESNIIQALLDSGSPTTQTATSIRSTISGWPIGKAPGKATWCSKRGLLANSGLSELAIALKNNVITYQEYNLILISKIWISDEKNTPAIFTNALQVLSLVDNTSESMANAVVTAYNRITGGTYSKGDFHSAELTQFCSIVSAAGFDTSRTGAAIKNIIGQWGCNFDSIKKPKYGWGLFPDFRFPTDVYSYTGNMRNGIFEAEFENPSAFNSMFPNIHVNEKLKNIMIQKIYYGAPGTGKSNEIKDLTGENGNNRIFERDCTFRTTFHPDSDYASFVGAYKPYWDKNKDKIVYGFRPQAFLKAYIKAWKNPDKSVALVIEEINRGNCAQIFGDIFQLLDREKNGLSKYPIECDVEMQELLAEEFAKETTEYGAAITDEVYASSKDNINNYYSAHYDNAFEKIKNGEILTLPMNLSILATMNTSDQSLFPMDSAFKRRWEWIYEPIVEGTDKVTGEKLRWKIEVDETHSVDWWKFLQKINAVIYSLTSSEDKQLGYFFCQPDKEDGVTISKNLFVGKVIFYLWNEIFKDYAFEHDVCKKENKGETLYFADFYEGKNKIKDSSLKTFFNHLDENLPKIDGNEVKLIEENIMVTPVTDTPADGINEGNEPPEDTTPNQNEEPTTENPEA